KDAEAEGDGSEKFSHRVSPFTNRVVRTRAILVGAAMLAGHRSGNLAGSIQDHPNEQHSRCSKDRNAYGLSHAALMFRVERSVPRKRQRPQNCECNKRRTNIKQRCVRNSLDDRLAVLGPGKKAISMNDCVV